MRTLLAITLALIIITCVLIRHRSAPKPDGSMSFTNADLIDKWFEFQRETRFVGDFGGTGEFVIYDQNGVPIGTNGYRSVYLPPESAQAFTNWLANRQTNINFQ